MAKSRKGYIRVGDYVEVNLLKTASYKEVVEYAIEVLDLEGEEEEREMEIPVCLE